MSKMGLTGTSLVAAFPAAILAFIMLRAVLGTINEMPVLMAVVSITLLLVAGGVAFLPAYLLIWYRGYPAPAKSSRKSAAETAAVGTGDLAEESEEFVDEAGASFEDVEEGFEAAVDDADETFEEYGDDLSSGGSAEDHFDADDFSDDAFDESFEFEDFEDEEK